MLCNAVIWCSKCMCCTVFDSDLITGSDLITYNKLGKDVTDLAPPFKQKKRSTVTSPHPVSCVVSCVVSVSVLDALLILTTTHHDHP